MSPSSTSVKMRHREVLEPSLSSHGVSEAELRCGPAALRKPRVSLVPPSSPQACACFPLTWDLVISPKTLINN